MKCTNLEQKLKQSSFYSLCPEHNPMSKKNVNRDDKEAKAYNWVLLATLLLVIFLVVQTPARIMANFLPNTTRVMFQGWGGTIWSGQVNSQYKGVQGQLRWQWQPLALLRLKLGLRFELITAKSQLQGRLLWGGSSWQLLDSQGQLAAQDVQQILSGWQLANNPIIIAKLQLMRTAQSWQDSQGMLTWQAGVVDYVLNGQRQRINLPPVQLLIKNEQQSLVMSLQDSQQAANLASFVVTGSMLESRLTQRLLSYSPNYRGVAEPDAIVVTSSQPLNTL